jgi:2-amino-4-hydroxy-6-hydroxymethyldihydropteridine diphosphokinase
MQKYHVVYLSLGSNLGDKLAFLNEAINEIQLQIGLIKEVSSVYESPAWGYKSTESFYNLVLELNTHFEPPKLLRKIKKIEKRLGRAEKKESIYEDRVIDIDIIDFDEQSFIVKDLNIPHQQMHLRRFVLEPMFEIFPNYTHPVFQESIQQLMDKCEDLNPLTKIKSPLNFKKYSFDQTIKFVTIEGNIGAGKTTLAAKIGQDFNAKTVFERFADNPFLPKFYQDQHRYAFPLEMSFLADRYQQASDDLAQFDLFKDFVVSDYQMIKSLIFAKVTLQADEYKLYKTLFDIIYKDIPKPDLYVYMYRQTDDLINNIKKRGRSYEKNIKPDYLNEINQGYMDHIKTNPQLNILVLDVTDKDFVKRQEDYIWVLEQLMQAKV